MRLTFHHRTRRPGAAELTDATGPIFRAAIGRSGIVLDDAQRHAADQLARPARHGHYLSGSVGRGKSLLADLYFASIPTEAKRRLHFHRFFHDLHQAIIAERAPLDASIQRLLGDTRAVVFDEFHVHDVADAVYLTATLAALFDRDILLLATSNYAPGELMPNPLFHDSFLPTIRELETRLNIVTIGAGPDYRGTDIDRGRGHGFATGSWRIDHPSAPVSSVELEADGHAIRAVEAHGTHLTATFAELCDRPLGTDQYLRLADTFDSVTVVDVPDPATIDRDPLLRFANLVDVLYDRDTVLEVVAAGPPEHLLDAAQPPRDAARTASRLATLPMLTTTSEP